MYAIVNISGKQYKVQANDVVTVDRLSAEVDSEVSFPVLMLVDGANVKVGTPEIKKQKRMNAKNKATGSLTLR